MHILFKPKLFERLLVYILPWKGSIQQKGDLVESDKYSEAKVGAFERGGHISEVFPYQ